VKKPPALTVALAAREAAEKKMKIFESHNAPALHPKPPQFSMLHAAAITGDKQNLVKLLNSSYFGSNTVDLRDKYGRTPLIFSVLGDHSECAEALLKAGALPGIKDKAGRNALHWASHHGHVKCLKALLNSKLAPKWTDRDNVSSFLPAHNIYTPKLR
jgi:ankyrin repeat protein